MSAKRDRRIVTGSMVILLACLALAAPFFAGKVAHFVLGFLMLTAGILELFFGFQLYGQARGKSVFVGSAMSIVTGVLLVALPRLAVSAQALLLGLSFALAGFSHVLSGVRNRNKPGWGVVVSDGLVSILIGVFIAIQWPVKGIVAFSLSVGLRMFSTGWTMLLGKSETPLLSAEEEARLHPDARLGLPPHDTFAQFQKDWNDLHSSRRRSDRYWCLTFVIVFFAIHVGRMEVEWNLIGLISPAVAAVGDVALALILAWCLIIPSRLTWRSLTRRMERRAWTRVLQSSEAEPTDPAAGAIGKGIFARVLNPWLWSRYLFSARLQLSRRSPTSALEWGLQIGLPLTAVLIALNPIWGMSWYFNSENWVTGAWEKWTEYRVDDWRAAMVKEIRADLGGIADADLFRVSPPGVTGSDDFSFIVIGDTGEGDASQHVLRDRFLLLGQRPDVRFLVLSSDVIYPSGAMKDYEAKFYLPFKGLGKPIYGLPGNHDWYDALESFTANFFEPGAARAAMRARRAADLRLTTTTDAVIEAKLNAAAFLRRAYEVQTGFQRAPFFELQTERFALLAVDTGILKSIDPEQQRWLASALERSRGKFKLAILGHPVYAGGVDTGEGDPPFDQLHQLLREHEVNVVMGGDTHSLEYYREHHNRNGAGKTMHHFVNGGGGAYLSIGTPLDWPKQPPVSDCGFYPRAEAITAKLDAETPRWKWPMWWWVKRLGAWPSTVESMAAAFDYNHAPFFQSFIEVRVEFSTKSVRLIPHGVHGPLTWREFQLFGQVMPAGRNEDDPAEFTIPMDSQR